MVALKKCLKDFKLLDTTIYKKKVDSVNKIVLPASMLRNNRQNDEK